MTNYIVIYREHNALNIDTKYYGPFTDHDEAYDKLCDLPALGQYAADGISDEPGCKYITELTA